jgi:uncharacterized protein YggU (UPF0235/DUF167 family)
MVRRARRPRRAELPVLRRPVLPAAGATIGGQSVPHAATPMKILQVKVKPNSRASRLEELPDGSWTAQLKSPPVEGRANDELIALVARHFGLRKAQVEIRAGASGRLKRVQLDV